MSLDLSRQTKLVPENTLSSFIKIYGVGSIGSYVAKILAKTGFQNIEIYDMDTVEEENLSAQAFDFKHIGMNKVDAMKNILLESAGIEIKANHGQVTTETNIEPEPNTVYCCFFDSIEGRKLVFDKVKDFPVPFIDTRIGLHNMSHYLIDCSDDSEKEQYLKTLEGETSELGCGEKASAPINVQLAGMVVMNIINYLSGDDYTKVFMGNAKATSKRDNVLKRRSKATE